MNIAKVPEIGVIVHISVQPVDLRDPPGVDQLNDSSRVFLAMRRDSRNASVVQIIGFARPLESLSGYKLWQTGNCAANTYATTVADTLQSLYEKEDARRRQLEL